MIDVKRFAEKGEYSYYRYFRHLTKRGNFSEDTYWYAFNWKYPINVNRKQVKYLNFNFRNVSLFEGIFPY